MRKLIFVKLGGGLITNKKKPYTPNLKIIKQLSNEIFEAKKKGNFSLLIGHGSGSFAHTSAKKYRTNEGFIRKNSKYGFCVVHRDALWLHKIVVDNLLHKGIEAFSISPSSCCLKEKSGTVLWVKVIKKILDFDIVPVIYGDAMVDTQRGCCIFSTEKLFYILAQKLRPKRIIITDKVNGVYTDNPLKNKKAKFIPKITKENWPSIRKCLKGSDGIDVTGGMVHKVQESMKIARRKIEVLIINGKKKGNLKKALLGANPGTLIKYET
ncbi:isopentenyl phosphate kinase family protein [bacterium]|nr:isopentenyl phosphate kinase family protein [bacterium]